MPIIPIRAMTSVVRHGDFMKHKKNKDRGKNMKCYYCHHRKGQCTVKVDRAVVVLCESCADRRLTMLNLSRKFNGPVSSFAQPSAENSFKIAKISYPS